MTKYKDGSMNRNSSFYFPINFINMLPQLTPRLRKYSPYDPVFKYP